MAKRRKPSRNPDHGKGLLKRLAEKSAANQDGQPEQYALMDFEITWEVMPDPVVEALPQATQDRMQKICDLISVKPKSVIKELRELAALHPDVPCLTNWLINSLRAGTTADRREAMVLCQDLFQRKPDYFFARTTLADLWLDQNELEKAAELMFGPGCVLTWLYPNRKVFHISEVRHWFYLCGRIKILMGEPGVAEAYRDLLEQLEPDSQAVVHLNAMLDTEESRFLRFMSKFKSLSEHAGKTA